MIHGLSRGFTAPNILFRAPVAVAAAAAKAHHQLRVADADPVLEQAVSDTLESEVPIATTGWWLRFQPLRQRLETS